MSYVLLSGWFSVADLADGFEGYHSDRDVWVAVRDLFCPPQYAVEARGGAVEASEAARAARYRDWEVRRDAAAGRHGLPMSMRVPDWEEEPQLRLPRHEWVPYVRSHAPGWHPTVVEALCSRCRAVRAVAYR